MYIRNIADLAIKVGANEETEDSISRRVYKDTACGAWVKIEGGRVTVGSIVEGADEVAESVTLVFPFNSEEFDEAVKAVEADAERIWNETHGCENCSTYPAVDPDCETCKGDGEII